MDPITCKGPLYVQMPDGGIYEIRPGFRQRGIAVALVAPEKFQQGGRGRPPSASALALRERLAEHHANDDVRPPRDYVAWLQRQHGMARGSARQLVYREVRKLDSSPRQRGRAPKPSTRELRRRLERDHARGKLRDAAAYLKWFLKRFPDEDRTAARQVVRRELSRLD